MIRNEETCIWRNTMLVWLLIWTSWTGLGVYGIPWGLMSSSPLSPLNDFLSSRLGKSFRRLNVEIKMMEMLYVMLVIRRSISLLLEVGKIFQKFECRDQAGGDVVRNVGNSPKHSAIVRARELPKGKILPSDDRQ